MRKLLFCLVLLPLTSCASLPTGPDAPHIVTDTGSGDVYRIYDRRPAEPPADALQAWSEMHACAWNAYHAGAPGTPRTNATFGQLRWFRASHIERTGDRHPAAMYEKWARSITITDAWWGNPQVLRHELLHHLLWDVTHGQGIFFVCDPFHTPEGGVTG